jgi:hypothetical protein
MPIIRINNDSFQSVPVFPLTGVHLFPHTVIPLNIFEPRYIEMVDYALAHDHLLTIADLDPRGDQVGGGPSNPALRPIMGAGVIVMKQEVANSRYHILVQGVSRVLLRDECDSRYPFRQVRAELLPDEESDDEMLKTMERDLRSLMLQYAEARPQHAEKIFAMMESAPNVDVLTNMLSAHAVADTHLRQVLFEDINPLRRAQLIYEHMGDMLLQMDMDSSTIAH